MPRRAVELGGASRTVEDFSGRKATRALRLLQYISREMPDITTKWGDFVRDYERTHVIELDRVQAQQRFGRRALVEDDGEPVYVRDKDGNSTGEIVMAPSFLDQMSEADWEKAGHKLRIPRTPSGGEIAAHLFPDALDAAEKYVIQLLALLVTPNADVKRYGRQGNDVLEEHLQGVGDDLLDDGMFEELMELAVVGGETVTDQYARKASQLGDRMGNALRLVGIKWSRTGPTTPPPDSDSPGTSDLTSSSSNSTSSSGSPEPTDGEKDESSMEPVGSSSTVSSAV